MKFFSSPVALLPSVIPPATIASLRAIAAVCFNSTPHSHSTPLSQIAAPTDLLAPIQAAGLDPSACRLEHSWLRRKVPPDCQPHSWHQDGGLGVAFPPEPGPPIPMTRLLTLWVPLDPCGRDAPGLEFVTRPLDTLLHFTELTDANLRQRFAPEEFWAPELQPGDALVFLNGTLHRTHYVPGMHLPRTSIEYRLFQDSGTE